MIFTIISSGVITSVISSVVASSGEKNYEDLLYAAEGGIELAYAQIKKGGVSPGYLDRSLSSSLEMNNVKEVKVHIEEDLSNPGMVNVKSTAYSKKSNSTKSVMCKMKLVDGNNPGGNIFKNGLAAGGINKDSNGNDYSIDFSQQGAGNLEATNVNAPGPILQNQQGDVKVPDTINTNKYQSVKFNNKVNIKEKIEVNNINDLKNMAEDFTGEEDSITKKADNGVAKFKFEGRTAAGHVLNFDVILVNVLKSVNGQYTNGELIFTKGGSEIVERCIIITNGNIFIDKTNLTLNDSTIFGNTIKVSQSGNLHIVGSVEETAANIGHGLSSQSVGDLHNVIKKFIPDWNNSQGNPSLGGSEVQFEEGSFEYE